MSTGKNNSINNRIPNTTTAGKALKSTSVGGVVEWGDIDVTVDQTYSATSTHAQSGTAVAGAVVGKLDATKSTYQTTAPTAAISDGGVHIVYLTAEPATKYDGYIYLIAE